MHWIYWSAGPNTVNEMNKVGNGTSLEGGFPPLLPGFNERGQAPFLTCSIPTRSFHLKPERYSGEFLDIEIR